MRTLFFYINFVCGLIGIYPMSFIANRLLKQGKKKEHDEYTDKIVRKRFGRAHV